MSDKVTSASVKKEQEALIQEYNAIRSKFAGEFKIAYRNRYYRITHHFGEKEYRSRYNAAQLQIEIDWLRARHKDLIKGQG